MVSGFSEGRISFATVAILPGGCKRVMSTAVIFVAYCDISRVDTVRYIILSTGAR